MTSPSLDSREKRELASEIKFRVSPALAAQIRDWARAHLLPDPHATVDGDDGYDITSLYFDTEQFDVFHRRGSFGRAKYRIRRYGKEKVIFLERKLRRRGMLTKRRSVIRLDELGCLTADEDDRDWPGRWFNRRINARNLKPVCQISYRRTARMGMTPYGPMRFTLDENLHALPVSSLNFSGQGGEPILKNEAVVELKFRCELPPLFKNLLEEFLLNPVSFSKYRHAAAALELAKSSDPNSLNQSVCHYA